MAGKTLTQGQPDQGQQTQQGSDSNVSEPDADTFQGLFDGGAFAPSTNEGRKPVQRYHPNSDQAGDDEDDGAADSDELSDEEVDAAVEAHDRAEAGEEGEAEEGEAPEGDEAQGPAYASVAEFLAAHKIDPDSFNSLAVETKINGETKLVPFAEVLKNFQLEGAITQKSQALSKQQEEWQAEQTAVRTLYKQQLTQAQALGQHAYNQLQAEYQGIDWKQLELADPTRCILLRQKFQDRHQEIVGHMQQVSQAQEAETQRSQQELIANLPKQREKMLEARPEWRDSKKWKAAQKSMNDYGSKLGFTDAELGSITDYRHMLILNDAASYAALQASAPGTLKKVRSAPPMAKPGARIGRNPQGVAHSQVRERFMKNPNSLEAGAAYFSSFIKD